MVQAHESKSLGKYRLIASLGQGGMAKVYLALMAGPAGFNKLLVVKILRDDLMAGSSESVQMFWQEARLAARLQHPNVVQTHEVGEFNGRYFIAMEYLDGQPYGALLRRAQKAPIALAEHLRIISSVARGLHYLHTLESYNGEPLAIVHRDVSPHNIFVTYEGEVKLLDFGIATTQDPEHFTRIGLIKGKIEYIAPEQLRAESVDGRSDVFSLGAVLWEAVSRHRFAGGRKVADAIKIQTRLTGGERRIRELVPDIDVELEQIVERAIASDPAARFSSAAAFADAIDAYVASLGERPSSLTLAQLLGPMFAQERSQTRALIDEQLQATKREIGASEPADWTQSLPQIKRETGDESSSIDARHSQYAIGGVPRAETARPQPVRPSTLAAPRSRRGLMVGATVALVGSLAIGIALSRGGEVKTSAVEPTIQTAEETAAKPAAIVSNTPVAPELAAAPQPERTLAPDNAVLQIEVSPAGATVTIDGVAVKSPFSGRFRKDSALHIVEASAEGFRSSKQFVKLERDQKLVIALARVAATTTRRAAASVEHRPAPSPAVSLPAAAVAPAAPPPKSAPVPGADIELTSPSSRGEDIDQVNPYRRAR